MPRAYMSAQVGGDRTMLENELYATVSTVTANYTPQKSDVNTLVLVNSSSGVTITLPASFPVGACISFAQFGAGAVTFAAGSGATLPQGSPSTGAQYAIAAAIVVANPDGASATWLIGGV